MLSLTFAFTAGVFAIFSPCGFPMFIGYISYYIGSKAPLDRALSNGVLCTLGLLTTFSIIGVSASVIGGLISNYIPLLHFLAGIIIIILGFIVMVEIRIPPFFPFLRAPKRKGVFSIFLYGIVYGLALLSCSAPIFLSVLFYAITVGSLLQGFIIIFSYAVGMSFPLVIITFLVARAKGWILESMVKATPLLNRISGVILIVVGAYLLYYNLAETLSK